MLKINFPLMVLSCASSSLFLTLDGQCSTMKGTSASTIDTVSPKQSKNKKLTLSSKNIHPHERAVTINEAIRTSFGNHPDIYIALSQKHQAHHGTKSLKAAMASFLPKIDAQLGMSREMQDQEGYNYVFGGKFPMNDNTNGWKTDMPPQANLQLSAGLNLFDGFASTNSLAIAEASMDLGDVSYVIAEQKFIAAAAQAFLDLYTKREALDRNKKNEALALHNLENERQRFAVGDTTRTNLLTAESQVAQASAQRVAAENNAMAASINYQNIIGSEPPVTLIQPNPIKDLPTSLDQAISIALFEGPNMTVAKLRDQIASKQLNIAYSRYMPQIGLRGQYTDGRPNITNDDTFKESYRKSLSVSMGVSMNLFNGFADSYGIAEAAQGAKQGRLGVEQARRFVIQEVSKTWAAYQTSISQVAQYKKQLDAQKGAFDAAVQEQQLGVSTMLNVLVQQQRLLEAELALINAEQQQILSAYSLLANLGRLKKELFGVESIIGEDDVYGVPDYGDQENTSQQTPQQVASSGKK